MDDANVIRRIASGETGAYGILVRRYQNALAGYFRLRMGPDSAGVEEAVQETLIAAYDGLGRLREPARFGGYLFGIASRLAGRMGRAAARAATATRDDPHNGGAGDPARAALEIERRSMLFDAVDALPAPQRVTVLLHHTEGLPCRETAEVTGVAVGTVRARLSRAYSALRKRVAPLLGVDADE